MSAGSEQKDLRWDLLESQPPAGMRLTARLAVPDRSREVFIAVDSTNRRHILVHVPAGEPTAISERATRGISIQTVEMGLSPHGDRQNYIEIACLQEAGHAALDIIARELAEAIQLGPNRARVRLVQGVLTKWQRFWSSVPLDLLTKEGYFGLFGELWFLNRWLLPSIGPDASVRMWRGPLGARNDFEDQGWAVEVKTSGKLDGSFKINGLEQLEDPISGELFLFRLLVREEASAVESLPTIIDELRLGLADNPLALSQFEGMLAAAGYDDTHTTEYGKIKLRVRKQGLYRVGKGFPRLVSSSIVNGLPSCITAVTYEMRLDAAEKWLIGETAAAAYDLMSGFASKVERN